MKFKDKSSELQYNLMNLNEVEIRKRLKLLSVKDRKKQRDMKNSWRRNKHKLMKGIKKWHKSTAGKRFHRALGRFNALREKSVLYYYDNLKGEEYVELSMSQAQDALLSLSSIETHLYLELQYYEPDIEAMNEFLYIVQNFVQDAYFLKESLLDAFVSGKISKEDYLVLTDIIQFFQDPKMYVYAKRDLMNLPNDSKDKKFEELMEYVKNIDLSLPNNEIYEKIDELIDNK